MNVLLKTDCELGKDLKICFMSKYFEIIVNEDDIYDEDNIVAVIDDDCTSLEEAVRDIVIGAFEVNGKERVSECIKLIKDSGYEVQVCNEECEVLYAYKLNKDMIDEIYNKVEEGEREDVVKEIQNKYKNQIREIL